MKDVQSRWEAARTRMKEVRIPKALAMIDDNCRVLGIKPEEFDQLAMAALALQKLADMVREKTAACATCTLTPEYAAACPYNDPLWLYEESLVADACGSCEKLRIWKEMQKNARLLGKTGMGKRFMKRTFDTFTEKAENKKALALAKSFCETFSPESRGIIFTGTYGCGKTHLAAAIVHELTRKKVGCLFVVVPDLLNRLKKSFDKDAGLGEKEEIKKLMEAAKGANVLVLDDLGSERMTDWASETLFDIVNTRYENELPMIVTTNCKGVELGQRIGNRTMSRLLEMCSPVAITDKDNRIA